MTRDDLDSITQEAGQEFGKELKHFAMRVAAAEREACAQVCDALAEQDTVTNYYRVAALAIRARGHV